jgi:hypothetical protein
MTARYRFFIDSSTAKQGLGTTSITAMSKTAIIKGFDVFDVQSA